MNTPSFKNPVEHIYIHWPFCSKKCYYCDFVALEQHESFQDAYHDALLNEITAFTSNHPGPHPLRTIYMGGGTPSLYSLDKLTQTYQHLAQQFNCSGLIESVIEANPADITEEKLDGWRECGINRISIGVQALNDDILLKLNRRQRISDVMQAMQCVPKYFNNISIDLILGLPGITPEAWTQTLHRVVTWPITHLSIYFLMVHEKTPLYFKVKEGEMILPRDETFITMYEEMVALLAQHGFEQYEISNFARKGYESAHNMAYWQRKPYRGFGLGAASFNGETRFTNDNNLSRYLEAYRSSATESCHTIDQLDPQSAFVEKLMLGLRQRSGIHLHDVLYLLQPAQRTEFLSQLDKLKNAHLIEQNGLVITLTQRGMALENEVVLQLM